MKNLRWFCGKMKTWQIWIFVIDIAFLMFDFHDFDKNQLYWKLAPWWLFILELHCNFPFEKFFLMIAYQWRKKFLNKPIWPCEQKNSSFFWECEYAHRGVLIECFVSQKWNRKSRELNKGYLLWLSSLKFKLIRLWFLLLVYLITDS